MTILRWLIPSNDLQYHLVGIPGALQAPGAPSTSPTLIDP
jgi:hypothetical protein